MEREFKLALDRSGYGKILAFCKDSPVLQTNYYFLIDGINKRTLRARRKGGYFELTYKRLADNSGGVFLSEETDMPVSRKVFEDALSEGLSPGLCKELFSLDIEQSLPLLGSLDTLRAKFDFFGCEIELDRNDYLFNTDYELEFECCDDEKIEGLKAKLCELGITGGPGETKSQRFLRRKNLLESKKYSCVLFDFDGTLCDTEKGIVNSMVKTCASFGLDISNRDLKEFFGPGLVEIYTQLLGKDKVDDARKLHEKIYAEESYKMNETFQGIPAILEALKHKGVKIGVATARLEKSTRMISEHLCIWEYFDFVFGFSDGKRENKADIIKDALCAAGTAKDKCLMVGDRFYDLDGAHKNGIDAVAALYGYGTEDELAAYPSAAAVRSTDELADLLRKVTEKE